MAELVDTVEKCQQAVALLCREEELAVDVEGIALSRQGELCLIQMSGPGESSPVYLFDICSLGHEAFDEGGLKALFESESITKIFYDVRSDNDALLHQFNVEVKRAYDVQVLWHTRFQHSDERYLQGLQKVQGQFLQESGTMGAAEKSRLGAVKEAGKRLFAPEAGGDYQVWKSRPLLPALVQYAAADIKFLIDMRRHWTFDDGAKATRLDECVFSVTADRLKRFVGLPDRVALDQSAKKFRDFDVNPCFNETGVVSATVPVPQARRGKVIGKKGATIQQIQSSTGTRVMLEDDGGPARIIGQPADVQSAVQQIRRLVA